MVNSYMYSFVYSILSLKAKRKSTSRSKSFLPLFYSAQNSVVIPGLSTQESGQKKNVVKYILEIRRDFRFDRLHRFKSTYLKVFYNWMLIGYHPTSCRDIYLLSKSIFSYQNLAICVFASHMSKM